MFFQQPQGQEFEVETITGHQQLQQELLQLQQEQQTNFLPSAFQEVPQHPHQQQYKQQHQLPIEGDSQQMLDTKKSVFQEFTDREAIKAASENVLGFVNFDLSKSEAAEGMTDNASGKKTILFATNYSC